MTQSLAQNSIVVDDYDESITFSVDKLGFILLEDTAVTEQNKRWVVVAPPGSAGCTLLLVRSISEAHSGCQRRGIGPALTMCTMNSADEWSGL